MTFPAAEKSLRPQAEYLSVSARRRNLPAPEARITPASAGQSGPSRAACKAADQPILPYIENIALYIAMTTKPATTAMIMSIAGSIMASAFCVASLSSAS